MGIPKIFEYAKASDGTQFKIQATGQNWTLYLKDKNSKRWMRVQSDADALFLKRVMYNQPEFRKLGKVL